MSLSPKYGDTKRGYSAIGYTSEDYDAYWDSANLSHWRLELNLHS
jgi:hypothetical protein